MSDRAQRPRVGIFGHVGNGNLGDEAIIAGVIQATRQTFPAAEVIGFTLRPDDTCDRHGISAFPIRRSVGLPHGRVPEGKPDYYAGRDRGPGSTLEQVKERLKRFPRGYAVLRKVYEALGTPRKLLDEAQFLIRSFRHLDGLDMLIIAGSQQLIDYVGGGPWGHPYTVLKWVVMAKAHRAKVAILSCGAGPINTRLGRLFVSLSLRLADYRSFRDQASVRCVERLGGGGESHLAPDLAFGLALSARKAQPRPVGVRQIVGVNPVPYWDAGSWVGGGQAAYRRYVQTFADFASSLVENGHWVLFFPTQLKLDPPVIQDIRSAMRTVSDPGGQGGILDWRIDSFDEMMAALALTDIVVGTRFHAIVLACLSKKPVLAIAYAAKTYDLMEQMGQGESVVSIGDLNVADLWDRFEALKSRVESVEAELARRTELNRHAVSLQYRTVFGLLGRAS